MLVFLGGFELTTGGFGRVAAGLYVPCGSPPALYGRSRLVAVAASGLVCFLDCRNCVAGSLVNVVSGFGRAAGGLVGVASGLVGVAGGLVGVAGGFDCAADGFGGILGGFGCAADSLVGGPGRSVAYLAAVFFVLALVTLIHSSVLVSDLVCEIAGKLEALCA